MAEAQPAVIRRLLRRVFFGAPPKAFADMDHWERHSYFYGHALRLEEASEGVLYFNGSAVTALFGSHLPAAVADVLHGAPYDARPGIVAHYLEALAGRCREAAEAEVRALYSELGVAA